MGRQRATQADLAEALGKSQAYVSRRLNGEVPFDVDDLFRLAVFFDVEVTELLPRPNSAWSTVDEVRCGDGPFELADVA